MISQTEALSPLAKGLGSKPTAFFLASILLWALGLSPALAADWPQYRGPGRDGVSHETGLLAGWPEGGPKVLWRRPLGEGYSGVSAVGDRLFTLYSDGESEYAVALEAASGEVAWRFRMGPAYEDRQGNGPRSTPTVLDGVSYAFGARGRLVALEAASGKVLWSRDVVRELGGRVPTWGISTQPLVEGDLLLVDIGGSKASVAALDKRTGELRWTAGGDKAGYSTPITVSVGGVKQSIFFTGTRVTALKPGNGDILWSLPWRTDYDVNAAAPIFVAPDKVFISSGYDVGAALFRLRAEGPEEIWRSREMKNQFSSSILLGDFLYGFDDGTLKCIRASTGEMLWRVRGFGHGSLTYADGHLYVLGDRGKLALVEATPKAYVEKSSLPIFRGKTWTVPTVANGRLYLRDEHEILALDIQRH